MEFTAGSGPALPIWLRITIVALLGWPFVIGYVRRRGDLRIFAVVPHLLSTTGAAIGLIRVAGAMSITGFAPRATAAGLAETFIAPLTGAAVSSIMAIFILVWSGANEGRRRQGKAALLVVAGAAIGQISVVAIGLSIHSRPTFSELLLHLVRLAAFFNLAVLFVALIATFVPGVLRENSQKPWFVVIAISSAAIAFAVYLFLDHLRLFALSNA